jgi:hypothetical protein
MDISALVQNFGFPVATAVFFIWMFVNQAKEHKADLKDIAVKSVQAIDGATEAIKDSTEQMKLNNDALGNNSRSLDRVNVVLSQRGQNNGNGIGN